MEYSGNLDTVSLFDDLPEVYKAFFSTSFQSDIPRESLSTCNNCAMVCRDKEKDISKLSMKPFQEDKKCCTYYPSLPSYLVGGALMEASPEGVRRVKEIIKQKIGVTPFGLITPKIYSVLYKNQSNGFGNSEKLLCPYFIKESGNCSIWKFRESVCSTYFCKHVAGPSGSQFWTDVKKYLSHTEQSLVQYLAKEAGLDYFMKVDTEIQNSSLTAEELDGLPSKDYEKIWGEWNGREEEFYKWAFQKVKEVSKSTFSEISGVREKVLLNNIELRRTEMLGMPEYLKIHSDWLPKRGEISKMIHLKSIDIQFELPSMVLTAFDGERSTSEVLRNLDENGGIEIESSLVLSLYQYGVLEKKE